MPKPPAILPRLRAKTFKLKRGGEVTYYFWDGRGRGMGTVALGQDLETAKRLWARYEQGVIPKPPKSKRVDAPETKAPRRKHTWTLKIDKWARRMYLSAESRALVYDRPFTITPADLAAVVERAAGCCEVSGLPFDFGGTARAPFSPSLDRIDCSKGYEPGNIRIVCQLANVAMNCWGIDPVLKFAAALCAHGAPNDAPIATGLIAKDVAP
jgi:hypothetical protein